MVSVSLQLSASAVPRTFSVAWVQLPAGTALTRTASPPLTTQLAGKGRPGTGRLRGPTHRPT